MTKTFWCVFSVHSSNCCLTCMRMLSFTR